MNNIPKWLLTDVDYNYYDEFSEWLGEVGVFCDQNSYDVFLFQRFEEYPNIDCPFCGKINKHYEVTDHERWKCRFCRRNFSITSETFLNNSKLQFYYWFRIVYLLVELRFPINSVLISRDLKVTQKTAYYMLITIKESLKLKGDGIKYKLPSNIDGFEIIKSLLKLNKEENKL